MSIQANADTRAITYLKAFGSDGLSRMSGRLSVPFAAAAVWVDARWAKTLWGALSVVAFFLASYSVWRNERNNATARLRELDAERNKQLHEQSEEHLYETEGLRQEITLLSRKPYDEELAKQAAGLIGNLSEEGKILLRHLVSNEPLDIHRQFRPEINQQTQSDQMMRARDSGIVRLDEVRTGNGHILQQNYIINSEFRPVLKDLLF
jgi:hypothetical protein